MARLVSLIILTVLIVFLGLTFYSVIAPFLLPLFLAGVLAVLCQPPFRWIERKMKGRTSVAAGITTFLLSALILVPLVIGTVIAAIQLISFTQHFVAGRTLVVRDDSGRDVRLRVERDAMVRLNGDRVAVTALQPGDRVVVTLARPGERAAQQIAASRDSSPPGPAGVDSASLVRGEVEGVDESQWNRTVKRLNDEFQLDELVAELRPYLGEDLDAEQLETQLRDGLQTGLRTLAMKTFGIAGAAIGFIGSFAGGLISLLMFVIAFYYFLADGPELLAASETLIPVKVDYQRQILAQFTKAVRAVVAATFLAAIAQGFATALALQFFGFGHFFLFLAIGTLTSMIPMLGTWVVWGPCAVWLAWQGHWILAGALTAFGSMVIGMLDNAIRTYVLHSDVRLHPLLAFVSVLGGLQALGLWGVFIGPIVASCLHALVQIFNTELHEFSRERFPTGAGERAGASTSEEVAATPAAPPESSPVNGSPAVAATPSAPAAAPANPSPPPAPRSKGRKSRKR